MADDKAPDIQVSPDPGAPVSLRKFIEAGYAPEDKKIVMVVHQGDVAIVADDPGTLNVLTKDREEQAQYFLGLNLPMPNYLRKYLAMMYPGSDLDAMYRHANTNRGMRQAIGLIQLVAGALNMARKQGKGVRFFIEEPETHLHPSQQVNIPDVLMHLMDEYGYKEGGGDGQAAQV